MRVPERFVAVDWSGARSESSQRKHIWLAEDSPHGFRAEKGRTREQLCEHIIKEFEDQSAVIGFDFAFSFPDSFFAAHGLRTVEELWSLSEGCGEAWLCQCPQPFWGRPGKKRPATHETEGFRGTDREININGIAPKSPLQIGGAGAVGTGSIRGMPILRRLRDAGFSIWPFDVPSLPMVVEIYPRLLTGPIKKSQTAARVEYLHKAEWARLPSEIRRAAGGSEDAFDAVVSAVRMRHDAKRFTRLSEQTDQRVLREGRIWIPG